MFKFLPILENGRDRSIHAVSVRAVDTLRALAREEGSSDRMDGKKGKGTMP